MLEQTLPPDFWPALEVHVGSLSEANRRWLLLTVHDVQYMPRRASREQALAAIASLDPGARRGRPRKKLAVPPRVHWLIGGVSPNDHSLTRARIAVEAEPRSPSRQNWPRYFLLHVLAAAWGRGRRLSAAQGPAFAFSRRPDQTLTGAFFEAAKILLAAAGRPQSDEGLARAIRAARQGIFAL